MIETYKGMGPSVPSSAYIHPSAVVIGQVDLGKNVSIWPCAVVRGDMSSISIGENTNIQDGCVLHVQENMPLKVGKNVVVGHKAVLHSCQIEDDVLIGMGAIVLDGAVVKKGAIVAAGSLVPPGKVVEPGTVVMGSPARYAKDVSPQQREHHVQNVQEYLAYKEQYQKNR